MVPLILQCLCFKISRNEIFLAQGCIIFLPLCVQVSEVCVDLVSPHCLMSATACKHRPGYQLQKILLITSENIPGYLK